MEEEQREEDVGVAVCCVVVCEDERGGVEGEEGEVGVCECKGLGGGLVGGGAGGEGERGDKRKGRGGKCDACFVIRRVLGYIAATPALSCCGMKCRGVQQATR